MNKYIEPTTEAFDSAEAAASDLLARLYPRANTKSGSAIRELVVRPMAYLYAWLRDNMERMRRNTSAVYLKTSQLTDNQMADDLASNYFIERRQGTNARGVVTIRVNSPYVQLPRGSTFSVSGVRLQTVVRIIATTAGTSYDGAQAVRLIPSGGQWLAPIPVQAVDTGPVELPAGLPATLEFNLSSLVDGSAVLTSAVTGGSGTETDAQLMARAEAATAASGVGSYFGIRRMLDDGPVAVLSVGVAAGEDAVLHRARYNTVNVSPGGVVDCYVKTQNQAARATLQAPVRAATQDESDGGSWTYAAELPLEDENGAGYHGVIAVLGVSTQGGEPVDRFSVSYGSNSGRCDWVGARLGVHQTTTVLFNLDAAASLVNVEVMYMPGLMQLQTYMDNRENRFLGQSTEVRAAIPAVLGMDCAVAAQGELDDAQEDAVKQAIANYVNGTQVGARTLNFSDIRRHCASVLTGMDLCLPCTLSAEMPLASGGIYSFYSNTGVLDLSVPTNTYSWNPGICYFSISKENIRLVRA